MYNVISLPLHKIEKKRRKKNRKKGLSDDILKYSTPPTSITSKASIKVIITGENLSNECQNEILESRCYLDADDNICISQQRNKEKKEPKGREKERVLDGKGSNPR